MTTTDTEDLIEAVAHDLANAMTRSVYQGKPPPALMFAARAAVASVRRWDAEHGLVTVPKARQTREMQEASGWVLTEDEWGSMMDAAPLPPGAEEATK